MNTERDRQSAINKLVAELESFTDTCEEKAEKARKENAPACAEILDAVKQYLRETMADYQIALLATPPAPATDGLRAALKQLTHDAIARRIGEHDMVQCRVCHVEGYNEVQGHQYGIKHKPDCSVLAALAVLAAESPNAAPRQWDGIERRSVNVFCGGCGKSYVSPRELSQHGFGKCVPVAEEKTNER
jgi:hypothetical protein